MADDDKDRKKPPLPPPGGLPPRAGGTPPPLPPGLGAGPTPPAPSSPGFAKLPGIGPVPIMPPGAGAPGLPAKPAGALPPLPGLPGGGLPPPPSASRPNPPPRAGFPMPGLPGMPSAPALPRPEPPAPPQTDKIEYERKIAELEKRLQSEHEKLLIASVKSQEEAANAAKVELQIKELQERLRRDRRDQEQEEERGKLETKMRELETRLASERETWVTTLRNQMQSREAQDKEIEAHFGMRVQEMERRWLEEKAHWQKLALAKDEEIRNLRSLAEKLKGADTELAKVGSERKWLEARVAELTQERAEVLAKAQTSAERERENIQLRADLGVARQQAGGVQERYERELQALRLSSREREERLLADAERLQRDLQTVGERMRAENEAEIRRVKAEAEAENHRYKEAAERTNGEMQKLRAIAGAMERQLAANRAQIGELQQARASWEKAQERYKAEFVVLQRKWAEREKEVRAEAQAQSLQLLDAEKAKLKMLAQDEINQRASRLAEQFAKEKEAELRRLEATMRAELEKELLERSRGLQADWEQGRARLEAELDRLHKDLFQKENEWSQRLMARESELHAAKTRAEDLASRLARVEAEHQELSAAKLDVEKRLHESREEIGGLQAVLADLKDRLDRVERDRDEWLQQKEGLERLTTAQAASVRQTQETLEQLRGQLARETHLTRLYLEEKEQLRRQLRGEAAAQLEKAYGAEGPAAPAPGPESADERRRRMEARETELRRSLDEGGGPKPE